MIAIYHQISDRLEKYIEENQISGRMPGILKLSKELGFNRVTLNKAVRELERRGVVTIDGTRGTFVNPPRQQEERQRYWTIGLVGINEKSSRHYLEYLNTMAEQQDYRIIGINYPVSLLEKDMEILKQFPVDGIIFSSSSLKLEIAEYLRDSGIYIACCNIRTDIPWIDSCGFNHEPGFSELLEYLKTLGHRRIAFLEYKRHPEYQYYLDLVKTIFRRHLGADYRDELIYDSDYQDIADWEYLADLPEKPTAVICPSNLAIKLRELLPRMNLKCEVIEISSHFKHTDFAMLYGYSEQLYKWILQRMLERLSGKEWRPEQKKFPLQLHNRERIAAPAKSQIINYSDIRKINYPKGEKG